MDGKQVRLSRGLLKTGQTISYQTGDDGIYQSGWWRGRKIADNKNRFIVKTLNGDDVVIDLATGLMWAADGNEAGCNNGDVCFWSAAFGYALALDFAGFSDWRIPNINELSSLIDYSSLEPCIWPVFFPNTRSHPYMSSTTDIDDIVGCWSINFEANGISSTDKTSTYYLRCVRGGV